MLAVPTGFDAPDLEVTAEALKTLRARDLQNWSSDRFRELTRPRACFRSEEVLSFCETCGIVTPVEDGWGFSESGRALVEALAGGEWADYGASVLRTGLYDDELTRLIEGSTVADGAVRCPRVRLRRLAPTVGPCSTGTQNTGARASWSSPVAARRSARDLLDGAGW